MSDTVSNPIGPLAGFSGAIASLIVTRRTLKAQNVIAERAKWRDKLRFAIEQAFTQRTCAAWRSLWLTLKINTNPWDTEDLAMVDLAHTLANGRGNTAIEDKLLDCLALLLKHDWERAKVEAGHDTLPALRATYEEYLQWIDFGMTQRKYWSGQRPLS